MAMLKLNFTGTSRETAILFLPEREAAFAAVAAFAAEHFAARRLAVIADATVGTLYAPALLDRLHDAGLRAGVFTFPPGEASKCRAQKARLEDALFAAGFGRDALVVALGGGVTGDLAGFVAATFCRGVPCIQVPTTVLAMADSSVGGKTGIDVPAGKNLVGAFHQPAAVFICPAVLATLPPREIRAGLVEVIKHGLILDRSLFDALAGGLARLARPVEEAGFFADILYRSCAIKAQVVSDDETEAGRRQILNFGHTVGHALERLSGWRLLHGEAVSLGITAALRMSRACAGLPAEEAIEAERLLARLGTPVRWEFAVAEALEGMRHDKKTRGGRVQFVLLEAIGRVARGDGWSRDVPEDVVADALMYIGSSTA